MQVFTSSGTFTIPAGVTKVKVTVVGGGGAGCGALAYMGPGGGGGGTAIEIISSLTPGGTVAVTVGAGGVGANGTGPTGGTSSFASYCSATGGAGGVSGGLSSIGGSGGLGSGGDLNIAGQVGHNGTAYGTLVSSGAGGGSTHEWRWNFTTRYCCCKWFRWNRLWWRR